MTPSPEQRFEFGESCFSAGEYSWRLKDGELRYRGTGSFSGLIAGRIPVTVDQFDRFVAAMNFLDVWGWKHSYQPADTGWMVLDGGRWWFKASLNGRECETCGDNAFPGYEDYHMTVLRPERFSLMVAAFYDTFDITSHIRRSQKSAPSGNLARLIRRSGEVG